MLEIDIAPIAAPAGSVFALTLDCHISEEQFNRIIHQWKQLNKDLPLMVIEGGKLHRIDKPHIHWISVAECLPPDGAEVLAYEPPPPDSTEAHIIQAQCSQGRWRAAHIPIHLSQVTHWHPLNHPQKLEAAGRNPAKLIERSTGQ